MSVVIREITASEHIDSAWSLLEQHREELTTHKEVMQLNPRRDQYLAFEANGAMLSLGLFDGDQLVGYSINIVVANYHYADLVVCQNDLLFVDKAHRALYGWRLLKATEKAAKERAGGQPCMLLWHAKEATNFEAILPRLGYGVQDVIFSKVL
jgi:hypothetical protein